MYFDQEMKNAIIKSKIEEIRFNVAGVVVMLENESIISIENPVVFSNNASSFIGKIILQIEETGTDVKFLLENMQSVVIDISEEGFGKFPEAMHISSRNGKRWIIRDGDVVIFQTDSMDNSPIVNKKEITNCLKKSKCE
jgi:hypothetical protein